MRPPLWSVIAIHCLGKTQIKPKEYRDLTSLPTTSTTASSKSDSTPVYESIDYKKFYSQQLWNFIPSGVGTVGTLASQTIDISPCAHSTISTPTLQLDLAVGHFMFSGFSRRRFSRLPMLWARSKFYQLAESRSNNTGLQRRKRRQVHVARCRHLHGRHHWCVVCKISTDLHVFAQRLCNNIATPARQHWQLTMSKIFQELLRFIQNRATAKLLRRAHRRQHTFSTERTISLWLGHLRRTHAPFELYVPNA